MSRFGTSSTKGSDRSGMGTDNIDEDSENSDVSFNVEFNIEETIMLGENALPVGY